MPTTLTVADFLSLRMQYKAEQAENEIPAVIEHNFKDGRMVDHYFVVPSPALLADEAVQDFGGKIENILFLQQSEPGAPWQVLLHEPSMIREITFEMPEEEFRAMLAIGVDNLNQVYVSDIKGIQVFSADGRYLRLIRPADPVFAIAFDRQNRLTVTENTPQVVRYAPQAGE